MTRYEIEKWTWDFRNKPSDPQYGNLTDRFIVDIRAAGTTALN